jgi:hypothetical protein
MGSMEDDGVTLMGMMEPMSLKMLNTQIGLQLHYSIYDQTSVDWKAWREETTRETQAQMGG